MEYISGRMADDSNVGAEKAANTKLASKPGGSCFWHWSIKLSLALLNEPVRSNTFGAKFHSSSYKNKRVFFLFFWKGKSFLVVFSIRLKPMYIAINYLIFPMDNILKIQDGLIEWGDMKQLITDMAFHHNIVSSMTYLH